MFEFIVESVVCLNASDGTCPNTVELSNAINLSVPRFCHPEGALSTLASIRDRRISERRSIFIRFQRRSCDVQWYVCTRMIVD